MSHPVELGLGAVLVLWGFADYLFPSAVLRAQSRVLDFPPTVTDALARAKRRMGLVCLLVGVVTVAHALS